MPTFPNRDELARTAIRRLSENPITAGLPALAASTAATLVVGLCCDEFTRQLDYIDSALAEVERGQVAAELAAGELDRERYRRLTDTTTPVGGVKGDE